MRADLKAGAESECRISQGSEFHSAGPVKKKALTKSFGVHKRNTKGICLEGVYTVRSRER